MTTKRTPPKLPPNVRARYDALKKVDPELAGDMLDEYLESLDDGKPPSQDDDPPADPKPSSDPNDDDPDDDDPDDDDPPPPPAGDPPKPSHWLTRPWGKGGDE